MEMLVVVAVIAVLVSVAVPSMMDYSNKAACAANAANLKTIKAEVTLAYQNEDYSKYTFTKSGDDIIVETTETLPLAKETTSPDCVKDTPMVIVYTKNPFDFEPKYGSLTAWDFAAGAEGNYVPEP